MFTSRVKRSLLLLTTLVSTAGYAEHDVTTHKLIQQNIALLDGTHVEAAPSKDPASQLANALEAQKNLDTRSLNERLAHYILPAFDRRSANSVFDTATMIEMELAIGPKGAEEFNLARFIDRTISQSGRIALLNRILTPSSDIEQIMHWQAATAKIYSCAAISQELTETLKDLAHAEQLLMSFDSEDSISSTFKQDFASGNKYLPGSSTVADWINKSPIMGQILHINRQLEQIAAVNPQRFAAVFAFYFGKDTLLRLYQKLWPNRAFDLATIDFKKDAKAILQALPDFLTAELTLGDYEKYTLSSANSASRNILTSFRTAIASFVYNWYSGVSHLNNVLLGKIKIDKIEPKHVAFVNPSLEERTRMVLQQLEEEDLCFRILPQTVRDSMVDKALKDGAFAGPTPEVRAKMIKYMKWAKYGLIGVGTALGSYWLYNSYKAYRIESTKLTAEQEKLMAVATYIRALDRLQAITKKNPTILNALSTLSILNETLDESNAEYTQLLNLLRSNTFNGDASFFSHAGNVRATLSLLELHKDKLFGGLAALAEADVLLSTVTLLKEATPDKPWSMVVFDTESRTPYVSAQEFWHPYFINKPVCNSVQVGLNLPRTMIITGPNAGGKTTVMKCTMVSAILGQSLGIAPAASLVMTPFVKIVSYLNITDDLLDGKSLFKAAVARAVQVMETVKQACVNGEFCLVGLDEIFNGTAAKEGSAAAYAFIKSIGECSNSVNIAVTHFPVVTELEEKNCTDFKNYKVTVVRHPDGRLAYPFRIEEGISDQNIAFDILANEGFDSAFIQDALDVIAA